MPNRAPRMPPRSPSIADVARLAGVSNQTVSRVATGARYVSDHTRAMVLAAMAEVGYTPNAAARALRSGSFGTIGVIVHQLSRTGESRTVEAIVEAARTEGYTVALVDVEQASGVAVEAAVARLQHQLIDALVIVRHEIGTAVNLRIPATMPYVISDARFVGTHASVGADQRAGTRSAIRHLLDFGHPTVHHISGPATSTPAIVRHDAWLETLLEADRLVPEPIQGEWSPEAGLRAGRALAARRRAGEDITAVFAASDEIAVGLLLALAQEDLRVPQDVSVVGFDNIPLAAYLTPPLTTVEQDFAAMGAALVELLLTQVRGRTSPDAPVADDAGVEVAGGTEARHATETAYPRRVVPADLIVRESTGPAPGR